MMKNISLILSAAAVMSLTSCSHDRSMAGNYDPNNPGYEYAPEGDMYHSVPYDPMSQYEGNVTFKNFKSSTNPYDADGSNIRMPVKGTIMRGKLDYYFPYKNTPEDYERAASLQNPYAHDPKAISEGKLYFETYCWQCHGSEASPKGSLVAAGKFPPPTWDMERKTYMAGLPEGKMFFSITYGRNLMGPHGPIVKPDQRWKIISYLKSVAGASATPANNTAPADTAKAAANTAKPNANQHQ